MSKTKAKYKQLSYRVALGNHVGNAKSSQMREAAKLPFEPSRTAIEQTKMQTKSKCEKL